MLTAFDARDPETYAIIGAAMEVHRQLGPGFLEAAYREALKLEFSHRGIPFRAEVPLQIFYKGTPLRTRYKADFICYDKVLVEVKAMRNLTAVELAQVLNYLKASELHRALLLNFGSPALEYRRFALGEP
jgi:GxxExxY protein